MEDDIEYEPELTDVEIERVNNIILLIKSELNTAIDDIRGGDINSAIDHIENSIDITDCNVCKKELGVLKANANHAHTICELGHDSCEDEKETLEVLTTELMDDFIPVRVGKKALIDKEAEDEYE